MQRFMKIRILQESVAAPTAGLHFDDELLKIKKNWGTNGNSKSKCWRWNIPTS
jgi:hypothetical protein